MNPDFMSRYLPAEDRPAGWAPGEGLAVDEPRAPAEPAIPVAPALLTPVAAVEPLADLDPAQLTTVIERSDVEHPLPPPPQWAADPAAPREDPRPPVGANETTITISPVGLAPVGLAPVGQHRPGPYAAPRPAFDVIPEQAVQWGASSTSWDITDEGSTALLRADDASLVRTRKVPPTRGWRRAVWVASGHTINLGAGPAEQALLDDQALIAANIPGNYQIAVVSVGGGVGKTALTAGLGTAFAKFRTDQVIAIDAAPANGKLGRRIDPKTTTSIGDFIADQHVTGYPMARAHTGKNAQGLEVLAGNQNVAHPFRLGPNGFGMALARTRRFYQLALIDCAPDIDHEVMAAVIGAADALVIVGTCHYDGAVAAETTINWLAARNKHALLRRSVLALNDVYDNASKPFVEKVHQTLGKRVGSVATVPWDPQMRDSAVLDWDGLRKQTARAYITLAATLARGFTTAGTVQFDGAVAGAVRR